VRYYITTPISGGTKFKCTFCKHSVTTLDFNSMNGNRRTQAAAMINQHAASLHLRTVPTKLDGSGNAAAGRPLLTALCSLKLLRFERIEVLYD
jgi:hypothetical protein